MAPLHAEPDQLFLASRAFWQANYRSLDRLFALRVALLRLEMTWDSDTSEEFFAEMSPLLLQLNEQMEELFHMGLILSHQADLWAEADQRWSGVFRDHPGFGEAVPLVIPMPGSDPGVERTGE